MTGARRCVCGLTRNSGLWAGLWAALVLLGATVVQAGGSPRAGREIYRYYCYQCHGYAGDARTLASTFLDPPPRDFTAADPRLLNRERMLTAVREGRPGTAMQPFSSVLSEAEIEAVVDFVRSRFMVSAPPDARYHTPENGWHDHDRYAAAFPFATGAIPLDTPWEELDETQRVGKRLFLGACISCHDRAHVRDAGPVWELRPLSYPRPHYRPGLEPDAYAGASPYAVHDRAPPIDGASAAARRGARIFQENCAFCHGADGSGRNWIGRFLEPHAGDLTGERVQRLDVEALTAVVREGLPDTSMPAWKHVLAPAQIRDVVTYVKEVLQRAARTPSGASGTAPEGRGG